MDASSPASVTGHAGLPSARDLARHVVEALAPEELPFFDDVAEPYLRNPRRAERRRRRGHDGPLAFDLGDTAALLTPVAALVSGSVITVLAENAVRSAGGHAGRLIRRFTRRRERVRPSPGLTPEQLAEVRQVAVARARGLGARRRDAEALADAIVSALARRTD